MDELTATLNARDIENTTTTEETKMETTTLTETTDYTQLAKEGLIALLLVADRKMANAAKNYAKLADRCRAAEARLNQQPQGMVAAPAPLSSQARREAYQAHLATVLPIGQPCSKAHCPTCNQTQSTNNKGRCIPCSNAAVKTFYAKR